MISVIMTSYNGEKFISMQIESILKNLDSNDELIISDDGSKDDTINIIKKYQELDNRIKYHDGPHKGLNENIKFLLSKVKGDYIFMADQDDIWYQNKAKVCINYLLNTPNIDMVHHNSNIIDSNGIESCDSLFKKLKMPRNNFEVFIHARGFGSMLCFRRRALNYISIPIKNGHDVGMIMCVMHQHRFAYIENQLMGYRRHDGNLSTFKKRNFLTIIKARYNLFIFFIKNIFFKKKVKY